METEVLDDLTRRATARELQELSQKLRQVLAVNDAQKPSRRVHTALIVVTDEDRFLALDGSAHQMKDCFRQLLERRPELRSVMQEVLNEKYRVEDR